MPRAITLRTLPDLTAGSTPVGAARVAMGAAALLEALLVAPHLRATTDPERLRLPVTGWLPAPDGTWAELFIVLWILVAAAFLLGWQTRIAGGLLVGVFSYTLLLDHQLYSNHLYLMVLLTGLLTLGNAGAALSLDARRRGAQAPVKAAAVKAAVVKAWPIVLIRLQVSIVYGFAAITKLNLVYLSGLVLRHQIPVPAIQHLPFWVFSVAAFASVTTEAFLAVALWSRRLRVWALVVGMGFHLSIVALLQTPALVTFALVMLSAYLSFFARIGPAAPATVSVRSADAPGGS